MPADEAHPEAAVAVGAMHIGCRGAPVVAGLIDETEPQPYRIGKIKRGDRTRSGRLVPDAVGGKGEDLVGKAMVLPAAKAAGMAAHRRRIDARRTHCHVAIDIRRQAAL